MSLSTIATHRPVSPGLTAAYLDWLQMLTGAALILFMWCHMILVSSVIVGPGVMNAIAGFFEFTYMAQLGGPAIFAVFLVHFVLASRKIPFRTAEQKVMWANAKRLEHKDTWLWMVQAATAMVILVMGAIHMWVVLTDLPISAAKSAARIQTGWWLLFYLCLLPMVELHVGIGLYRIAVKWGFVGRKDRSGFKVKENSITYIFIGIGVLTLIRFMFLAVK
ncbi:MAG: succinate dehydrogenase/fumarate reductase cytochrome b subunit [Desulfovibrionaceae bacterium]|nr:succinate dehydrogenase/fumarate reductase cytochrome b subunit [Desulfovibrionaceae bacterium]MBF0513155.1 succinate dehydrogenase/fumarate reductase cytochrome b subunit [Desulfovibrionaceae bacterium]